MSPAAALAKNVFWTSWGVSPESASASARAASARLRTDSPACLPNGVMPTPATVTSRMTAHQTLGAAEVDGVDVDDAGAGRPESLDEEPGLHLLRRGLRQRVDDLDDVGHVAPFESLAAVGDERRQRETGGVGQHHGGHDVGLARGAGPGGDPVDVDVVDPGKLGDDPADEAFGDELAQLAEATLLLAVEEEQEPVGVAPDGVAGVETPAPHLLGRRLGVLVVLHDRLAPDRPQHEFARLARRDGSVLVVDDVGFEEIGGRLPERADRADAHGLVGEAALHRP